MAAALTPWLKIYPLLMLYLVTALLKGHKDGYILGMNFKPHWSPLRSLLPWICYPSLFGHSPGHSTRLVSPSSSESPRPATLLPIHHLPFKPMSIRTHRNKSSQTHTRHFKGLVSQGNKTPDLNIITAHPSISRKPENRRNALSPPILFFPQYSKCSLPVTVWKITIPDIQVEHAHHTATMQLESQILHTLLTRCYASDFL